MPLAGWFLGEQLILTTEEIVDFGHILTDVFHVALHNINDRSPVVDCARDDFVGLSDVVDFSCQHVPV
jgi:hypothetical protein